MNRSACPKEHASFTSAFAFGLLRPGTSSCPAVRDRTNRQTRERTGQRAETWGQKDLARRDRSAKKPFDACPHQDPSSTSAFAFGLLRPGTSSCPHLPAPQSGIGPIARPEKGQSNGRN